MSGMLFLVLVVGSIVLALVTQYVLMAAVRNAYRAEYAKKAREDRRLEMASARLELARAVEKLPAEDRAWMKESLAVVRELADTERQLLEVTR